MLANPSRVIIRQEDYHRASLHGLSAHHRDFPEVHCAGSSPKDAAERLGELLRLTLDNAPSEWRRETLQQAIEDVLAFAERDCS
jgi:predicted RNase H-like HicB family nuclease